MRGFGTRFIAMSIAGMFYMLLCGVVLLLLGYAGMQFLPQSRALFGTVLTFWKDITIIIACFLPAGILLKLVGITILREPSYMDQQQIGHQYIGVPRLLQRFIDRIGAI